MVVVVVMVVIVVIVVARGVVYSLLPSRRRTYIAEERCNEQTRRK